MASPCVSSSPSPHSSPASSPFDPHAASYSFYRPDAGSHIPMFNAFAIGGLTERAVAESVARSGDGMSQRGGTRESGGRRSRDAVKRSRSDAESQARGSLGGRMSPAAAMPPHEETEQVPEGDTLAGREVGFAALPGMRLRPTTSAGEEHRAGAGVGVGVGVGERQERGGRPSAAAGRTKSMSARPQLPAQLRMGMNQRNLRMMMGQQKGHAADSITKRFSARPGPESMRRNLRELLKHSNSDPSMLEKAAAEAKEKTKVDAAAKHRSKSRLHVPMLNLEMRQSKLNLEPSADDKELSRINKDNEICMTQRASQTARSGPSTAITRDTGLLSRSASLPSNFKLHVGVPQQVGGVAFLARSGAYEGGATLPQTRTEVEYLASKGSRSTSHSPKGGSSMAAMAAGGRKRSNSHLGRESARRLRDTSEKTATAGATVATAVPSAPSLTTSVKSSSGDKAKLAKEEKEKKTKKRKKKEEKNKEKKKKDKKKDKDKDKDKDKEKEKEKEKDKEKEDRKEKEKEEKREKERRRKRAVTDESATEDSEEEDESVEDEEVAAISASLLAMRPSAPQPHSTPSGSRSARVFSQQFSPQSPRLVRPSVSRPESPRHLEMAHPITPRSEGYSPPITMSPRSAFSTSVGSPRRGARRSYTVSGIPQSSLSGPSPRTGSPRLSGPSGLGVDPAQRADRGGFLASFGDARSGPGARHSIGPDLSSGAQGLASSR